jgi:hypothetical protein
VTTWEPVTTVTIDAADYTGDTLEGVTITLGRKDTTQQPQPGYARMTVLDLDGSGVPFGPGAPLTVTIEDTTTTSVTLFTGTVSDVQTEVRTTTPGGGFVVTHDVLAVGPMAVLNRRVAGGSGFAQENDGDRIDAIITEADPTLAGTIDTPGLFTLADYTGGAANAYTLAATAAASGLGVIYETPTGLINYDDADHRTDNALLNGYLELPTTAILAQGLSTTNRLGDLVNTVTVSYDGGEVTVTNALSTGLYGELASSLTTVLADASDAADQGDRYVTLNGNPKPSISQVVLPLANTLIDDTLVDALLNVYVGQPIRVPDLPPALGNEFSGFVEGWTWTLNQTTAFLDLAVSDFSLSTLAVRWEFVDPTTEWDDLDPLLTWQEALVIA